MKKITINLMCALAVVLTTFSASAQFGCGSAVVLTNGYTAAGITTPGNGGMEDWNANPTGTSISASYWDDDVYLFQYTATASVMITMETFSRNSWNGIGIFTTCSGNTFSGELDAMGTTGANSTKTVSAALDAGQTVYIATGQWGTPDGLDFDVVSFTVAPLPVPGCVTLTTPANASTNVNTDITLVWPSEVSATGYYLNVGTTSGGTDVLNMYNAGNTTSYNIPGVLMPNTTYYVTVMPFNGVGTATGCTETSFTTGTPPANDNCSGAVLLTANSDTACATPVAGTTAGATQSMAAAPCGGNADDDVWYSFVATSPYHSITLSNVVAVTGTSTDIYFEVRGGACDTQTSLLCSDPNTGSLNSLTVGSTYYVRVFSTSNTSTQSFNICVTTPPAPPANDDCAGAVNLTVNPTLTCTTVTSSSTVNATQSMAVTPCFGTPDDDVWFRFTATATSHNVSLSNVAAVSGTSTDMYFQVLSGDCGTLTSMLCSDPNSNLATGLTIGSSYFVRVYSYGSTSRQTFDICIGTAPAPPANDEPAGAIALTVNADLACAVTTNGTTISATPSTETAPSCSATGINDDVWYTFTATSTGHRFTYSNVTTGTMATALYTGTPGSLVQVANACSSATTQNFIGLTVGTTYYARVFTSTATAATTTNFTVCVGTLPAPPANDDFANAIAATCDGTYTSDTTYATLDQDNAPDGFGADMDSPNIWYTFTGAGTPQTVTLNLCGSGYDTSVLVYTGTAGNLAIVAGNDDDATCGAGIGSRSRVSFTSDGTTTYYIAVEGYNPTNVGTTNMVVTCEAVAPPAVPNQTCALAAPLTTDGTVITSDNTNGTVNSVQPSCDTFGSIQDVWFSFVAPPSGSVNVTVTNVLMTSSNFNVYSGTCAALVAVPNTCNSNLTTPTTEAMTGLVAGNTYYIQVWSGAAEEGTFTIAVTDATLATTTFDNAKFVMYPNPVVDVLNISGPTEIQSVQVINMLGQQVLSMPGTSNDMRIDLSSLAKGAYLVKVINENSSQTLRILKQ